jgi:hypothetical protein
LTGVVHGLATGDYDHEANEYEAEKKMTFHGGMFSKYAKFGLILSDEIG